MGKRGSAAFVFSLALSAACGADDDQSAGGGGASPGGSGNAGGAGGSAGAASSGGSGGDAGGGGGGGNVGGGTVGPSRGYVTTPAELASSKQKADQGQEPYAAALASLSKIVGSAGDWPYGSLDGDVTCGGTGGADPDVPAYIANSGGGPLVLGKAYVYRLTGDAAFAAEARARILDLVDTTGWGGDVFDGSNQCILNLAWFMPRFIQAADLLEGSPVWSAQDKAQFGSWLAAEVYRKVSAASDKRINNWGSAGSYTSAVIADYLTGSAVGELVAWDGSKLSPAAAWKHHNAQQLARMNGSQKMDSQCASWGIEAHGGIPDELRRGSSGCAASYILEQDASYTYQLAHIQSLVAHAELMWRRGSTSFWENLGADKKGSIRQSILFVIDNPTKSWPWTFSHLVTLELGHRYYRDPEMCTALVCDDLSNREISGTGNRVLSFTTLTHGFAPSEDPGPPPTSTAP